MVIAETGGELLWEYLRYKKEIEEKVDHNSYYYENYRDILNTLKVKESSYIYLTRGRFGWTG